MIISYHIKNFRIIVEYIIILNQVACIKESELFLISHMLYRLDSRISEGFTRSTVYFYLLPEELDLLGAVVITYWTTIVLIFFLSLLLWMIITCLVVFSKSIYQQCWFCNPYWWESSELYWLLRCRLSLIK